MKFDAVYTVKKEFGKEEFLRALIIELGMDEKTPLDVVDAKFGEVEESVEEIIVCKAKVKGTCTASVGYDRREPYTDYETYREKVGDSYVTRQRAVTKYRTVTDWQAFQTSYSGESTSAVHNRYAAYESDAIIKAITTAKSENIVVKGEAEVNPSGLRAALSVCEKDVERDSVSFPGDHHKDAKYNSESEVESLSCYKLPEYSLEYTYNGKKHRAYCYACGDVFVTAIDKPENLKSIRTEVEEKTKGLAIADKASWIAFAVSFVLSGVLCIGFKFPWLFPLPVALLISAVIIRKTYEIKYSRCSRKLSGNLLISKYSAVNAALRKYGYREFSAVSDYDFVGDFSSDSIKVNKARGRIVGSFILLAILAIISFSVNQKNLHSPKYIDIEVVDKQVERGSDGYYYIKYECEIESEKVGLSYIDFEICVSDKEGKELGTITNSLYDLNTDAGDKKMVTLTLKEKYPEDDKFFTNLYNTELSELILEYEIDSIKFIDGRYYRNKDKK